MGDFHLLPPTGGCTVYTTFQSACFRSHHNQTIPPPTRTFSFGISLTNPVLLAITVIPSTSRTLPRVAVVASMFAIPLGTYAIECERSKNAQVRSPRPSLTRPTVRH